MKVSRGFNFLALGTILLLGPLRNIKNWDSRNLSTLFDFCSNEWSRMTLVYRKNDRKDWSGNHSCFQFMSAMVEFARERNIKFDEIKLDSSDSLYSNDSEMLQNEMGDYSGKTPSILSAIVPSSLILKWLVSDFIAQKGQTKILFLLGEKSESLHVSTNIYVYFNPVETFIGGLERLFAFFAHNIEKHTLITHNSGSKAD